MFRTPLFLAAIAAIPLLVKGDDKVKLSCFHYSGNEDCPSASCSGRWLYDDKATKSICGTLSSGSVFKTCWGDSVGCAVQDFDVKWFAKRCKAQGNTPGKSDYCKSSGASLVDPQMPDA
ncbi:hypothetical protein MCAP1_002599 [Malassezia caprae]|uniref:Uncharacterized protein n=1 Tax=Malassezia caprae TaxID=1381934 RepID=A0AAF0E7P2_9BASI|nr:hypothetical protein MCAP1_002599 [Malassezia caprae]